MKRLILFLTALITLSLGTISCRADTVKQATDVFEVTDNGQKLRIATVLDEGMEYEPLERVMTTEGSVLDSYFYASAPIEWIRVSYQDSYGSMRQGWIVANPNVISGIKMSVFDETKNEEYNGYDLGFVLCESLSLKENPNALSKTLDTLEYGTNCTIVEENDSWYKVVYLGKQDQRPSGWVRKDYVLVNPSYFTPDGETPVYAIPSADSKRIGLILDTESYPIIDEYNGFLAISLRGASGFVVNKQTP